MLHDELIAESCQYIIDDEDFDRNENVVIASTAERV